jgi:hypothetical protein
MSRPVAAKQASIAAYVDITPGERPKGLRSQDRSPITFPKNKGGLLTEDLSYLEDPHESHNSNAGKSLKAHISKALGLIAASVGTASTIATEAAAHAAKARTAPSRDKYLAEKHNALMILQVRVPCIAAVTAAPGGGKHVRTVFRAGPRRRASLSSLP